MTIENVAIIGKGALGLLFGTQLAACLGNDAISYLMDDARYERHAAAGLDSITINGTPCPLRNVRASDAAPADLVLIAIKTTGLEQTLDTMERAVGPGTRIISVCNGITSEERIAERYGWKNTVLAVAQGMNATFMDGALEYTQTGQICLGAADGTDPAAVTDIADLLARAGIDHVVEQDIRHRMWTKLMLNVGINQTCMVYGGTYGSVTDPAGEQFRSFIAAMREVRAVAAAEGVTVSEQDLSSMVQLTAGLTPTGMPSMAQDRINRRLTEVDEFAGTIIRLAEKHSILVPQNRWLYQRVREIENDYAPV